MIKCPHCGKAFICDDFCPSYTTRPPEVLWLVLIFVYVWALTH